MRLTPFVLAGALFLGACDGLPPPPQAGPSPSTTPTIIGGVGGDGYDGGTASDTTGCEDRSSAQAGPVNVITDTRTFFPSCFAVSSSQGIQLENMSDEPHTFTIPDLVDVEVEPKGRAGAEHVFESLDPGTYEFTCRYHGDAGMVGVVIVE